METISDYQPILICLVETHLQKEEEIRIPGYSQIFRNDRSGNSGGIMLAVKENIKTVTLEVTQEKEIGKSLRILLDNNRSKIRIEVIYAPQENVTSNNELKVMYNNISKQISIAQEERQQVLILGDFNAKVGTYIEGNKPTVTKGGRQLMKMATKYDLVIAVKENIKTVTLEVTQEKEIGQSLWILLDNNRSKIRIGVIYAPQENVTSKNELKVMCNNISKQISIAQEERQQVLILGDFNTKVGTYIKVTNQQ